MNTVKTDTKTDVKVVVPISMKMNTNERLDRLERLIVRVLLALPADVSMSRMINTEALGRVTANALNKRFYQYEGAGSEAAMSALKCVLDMCVDDIAAEQAVLDKHISDEDTAQQAKWRAKLEADKVAAQKVLADAEAKLNSERVIRPESKNDYNVIR